MPLSLPFDHFDWIAPLYNQIIPPPAMDKVYQYGKFPTSGRILDLGGGTGRVTRELIASSPHITIADRSFGMLSVANRTIKVNLTLCQAETLPFASNSFERILLIDTLHHVIDAKKSLIECIRVLKQHGLLIIQEPDIEQWGGRLIALFEKLLLMRSHLLPLDQVKSILHPIVSESTSWREKHQYWVICQK
jgi:demethylmenaquinone methyltransferase/2-methoxy-6-polyprenyl-1,4-benzoquinol methylase